jgi:hypothetical protein
MTKALFLTVVLILPAVCYAGIMYLTMDYISPVIIAALFGLDGSISYITRSKK